MSRNETVGPLECTIIDQIPEGQSPELLVVLCHGYGAPSTDLVPIGQEVLNRNPEFNDKVRFVFPGAPLSLDSQGMMGGRAWWPLDMEKLQLAIMENRIRDLRNDFPEELPKRREELTEVLEILKADSGLSWDRIVLGGFSQGSMLATDVALHLGDQLAGLCIWSGTLLCEENWKKIAPSKKGMKVFQSHGRFDQILPFGAAEWLRDLLMESGIDVNFLPFDSVHTIPEMALEGLSKMISESIS